jgi:hypothetical protein
VGRYDKDLNGALLYLWSDSSMCMDWQNLSWIMVGVCRISDYSMRPSRCEGFFVWPKFNFSVLLKCKLFCELVVAKH